MRAVIQRVNFSNLKIDNQIKAEINKGLVVLLGVDRDDTEKDALYIAKKISNLRIFEDEHNKMNLSIKDINGEILSVSQFTIMGNCKKGNRPSFCNAANAAKGKNLYDKFNDFLKFENIKFQTGVFQANMDITLENNGPVTILLDSKKLF